MKKVMTLFFSLIFFLSACSNEETKQEEKVPELIEVTITTPDKIKVQEEITIEASVVQGKEKVTDADEVKFEIWKDGQDAHEMVEAAHQKDGIYTIKKTFSDGGNYNIVAHTTARSLHSMPKKEILVEGEEEIAVDSAEGSEHSHENQQSEGSEHEHDDHHNSAVDFEFHVHEPIKSNQETKLTVHLKQGSEQIAGATVRFEIWGEDQSKHDFIPAVEGANGEYSLSHVFPSSGVYTVKIHVEKGDIHDHTEKTVKVN